MCKIGDFTHTSAELINLNLLAARRLGQIFKEFKKKER